jgi:hypothetical protein
MMQEVHCMKRICESYGYQVRRAVRAGDRRELRRDFRWFVSLANRTSQIGSDPMSISPFFSAEEQLVGFPEEIHL